MTNDEIKALIERLRYAQYTTSGMRREAADALESLLSQLTAKTELAGLYATSLAQSEREAEGFQQDAERYRYLRSIDRRESLEKEGSEAGCWIDCEDEDGTLILLTEEDADKAIDAARSQANKGNQP